MIIHAEVETIKRIKGAWERFTTLHGEPEALDIASVNLARIIGLHLQGLSHMRNRSISLAEFQRIQPCLPPALDFKRARLCVQISRRCKTEVKEPNEVIPTLRLVHLIRGGGSKQLKRKRRPILPNQNPAVLIFNAFSAARCVVDGQTRRQSLWTAETRERIVKEIIRTEQWLQAIKKEINPQNQS